MPLHQKNILSWVSWGRNSGQNLHPKVLDVCAFFEVTNVLEKCLPFYFQQDIACFTISIYMHKKVEIAKSEKGENKNKSILENLNTCFRL